MKKPNADKPIRLTFDVADKPLRDRLVKLLSGVDGLSLAQTGEPADIVLSMANPTLAGMDAPLTNRELEVLTLLSEGASNKEIAKRLGISVHTAKFHVRSVTDKLDAVGRTDAVVHAARRGVINL